MTQHAIPNQQEVNDRYRDFIIQVQTGLTAIPAIGPESKGEGEAKKAEYIKKLLGGADVNITYDSLEEVNAPDDRVPVKYRPNLIYKIKGKSDAKTIWIMSHMDIVPPGDTGWVTDPYQVVEKDGKLYGRGTEDNQQAIVSSLLAVKMLQDLNLQPEYNVGLLFVADEETGSGYGIEYVLAQRPELFQPHDLILVPDSGDPGGLTIEVAEKSSLWIKCETKGKGTHGSTPEKGKNAHKAGAHLIVKMNNLYKEFAEKDDVYDPPISTFEPTKKEKNVDNVNTIPADDIFYFDCRILPCYPLEKVKGKIRQWADEVEKEFGVEIIFSYPQEKTAPTPTPVDAPVVSALQKAVKEVTGHDAKTIGIGGGTVAACFREKNLPAVCWSNLDESLHQPNEYCKIDNVITDARVFAHIFRQV
jgi:succinyl-diaminopimelate desuccinylase